MTLQEKNAVAKLMVGTLVERLGDEVELVFHYGSTIHGGTHRFSDLDFSYVPRHPNTWESITVLVDDILFDLYPLHWETLERMAEHDDWRATILADLEVVHARSEDARTRLSALIARHRELERPDARADMVRKALVAFERTGFQFYQVSRTVRIGEVDAARIHTNRIIGTVFHALVLVNQSRADTRKLDQMLALERRPERLGELVDAVLRAPDGARLVTACTDLLDATREVLLAEQAQTQRVPASYPDRLGPAYPELKADLQRVLLACERRDLPGAQTKLFSFLHELHIHLAQGERGIDFSDFNSPDEYRHAPLARESEELVRLASRARFDELHEAASRFDRRLREYLTEIGVGLFSYESIEELQAALEAR
jgi:hypothetical protein